MYSLYTSIYNLSSGMFDWELALENFSKFGDEVCIGFIETGDNTLDLLKKYCLINRKVKVIKTDFSLNDPEFDGKVKNAALQATIYPIKILLDIDEAILSSQKNLYKNLFDFCCQNNFDGCMIPSINLIKDIYHYKDIGYKFYMHRGGLSRGTFPQAKNIDGSIDISRSDTTELLDENGNLAKCMRVSNNINDLKTGTIPYIFHKWAIDAEKRIKQNKFWKPHWENRAKKEVNNIILDKEKLDKIEYFPHGLDLWYE